MTYEIDPKLFEGHTGGEWRAVSMGGSSTVVSSQRPGRNDTRIPAHGYNDGGEHCLAYPFIEDSGSIRLDFVCFSHADAKLFAAAPTLLARVAELEVALKCAEALISGELGSDWSEHHGADYEIISAALSGGSS